MFANAAPRGLVLSLSGALLLIATAAASERGNKDYNDRIGNYKFQADLAA